MQIHQNRMPALVYAGLLLASTLPLPAQAAAPTSVDQHQLGTKYSPLARINRSNVTQLEKAWEYHTGETPPEGITNALIAFEDQPSLVEGNLVVCTVSRRLIALDPTTGAERWQFDPETALGGDGPLYKKCRGIGNWVDTQAPEGSACRSRLFLGTLDYKLFAIDAKTGKRCAGFGDNGVVDMPVDKALLFPGEVVAGSNPAVVNDVVVVASAVIDNQRVNAPSGRVQAFDARTGKPLWTFDPVPRDPADPAAKTWERGSGEGFGGGNVWASMAVDTQRDLVYLPTTSPSGDFFGGGRAGDNLYTSAIVALRGASGEVVWHFQFVHHNVFDYDTPSKPLLIDYPHNGEIVPALVQNNKTGLIFIFNRETGEPLVPIEERAVPVELAVPGETLSKTQPFPVGMPAVMPLGFSEEDAWGFTFIDKWLCKRKIAEHNYGPIFTPPSAKGTIFSPSMAGGPNWGGGAYDPESHIMVVPSNRMPLIVSLKPRTNGEAVDGQALEVGGAMVFDTTGSPYLLEVEPLLSPLGTPCSAPPWAALTAVDLVKKEIVWEAPLGSIEKLAPVPIPWELGTPGAGGPLVTAGGLVFIGYTLDDKFRAFDLQTGEVVWKTELPAAGTAVPVTYEVNGEQYIVIPAGGHSMYGSTMGDSVVAYKLKQ